MRLAFAVADDPRSKVTDAETLWEDPEARTEGEHVDALLKLSTLGVPQEQLWQDAGYSPQDIARFRRQSTQDLFGQMMAARTAAAATPAVEEEATAGA